MRQSVETIFKLTEILDLSMEDKCRAELDLARDAMDVATAKLVCLEVEAFFERRPYVEKVRFFCECDHDDDGHIFDVMRVHVTLIAGGVPLWGENDVKELGLEAACKIKRILAEWTTSLDGETLTLEGHSKELGSLLMGMDEYEPWMARREAVALEEGIQKTAEAKKTAPRI